MKSMNLKMFKKVHSDDKHTIMRNDKGHELRISHHALTPKMKTTLDNLPIHKDEGGGIGGLYTPEAEVAHLDEEAKKSGVSTEEHLEKKEYYPSAKKKLHEHLEKRKHAHAHKKMASGGEVEDGDLDQYIRVHKDDLDRLMRQGNPKLDESHKTPAMMAAGGNPPSASDIGIPQEEQMQASQMPSGQAPLPGTQPVAPSAPDSAPAPKEPQASDVYNSIYSQQKANNPALPDELVRKEAMTAAEQYQQNQKQKLIDSHGAEREAAGKTDAENLRRSSLGLAPLPSAGAPQAAAPSPMAQAPQAEAQAPAEPQVEVPKPETLSETLYGQKAKPVQLGGPGMPDRGDTPEAHSQNVTNKLMQDTQHLDDDILKGHIQPKTFGSLFADAKLPGKIGMIFGSLLGGLGSGLTGRPNMFFEQMNKAVQNDLAAQEKSTENAHNLLKINQAQAYNIAHINLMKHQGHLTEAEAAKAITDAKLQNYALTNMQANRLMMHNVAGLVDKMPEGPDKQKARDMMTVMSGMVDQKNLDIASQAGIASAMTNFGASTSAAPEAGGGTAARDAAISKEQQMAAVSGSPAVKGKAEFDVAHTIPGVPGTSSQPISEQHRVAIKNMNTLDDRGRDLLNFIKQNKGKLFGPSRKAAEQKVEEMKNFYNGSIGGGALTEGRLGWYNTQFGEGKNPLGIINYIMGQPRKYEEILNSNNARRRIELETLGFPKQPTSSTQQQGAAPIERLDRKSGKVALFDPQTKQFVRWK